MTTAAKLDISTARKQFNGFDRRLQRDNVIIITRHGRDAFAVVSLEYLSMTQETFAILADPDAMQMLQESLDDIRAGRVHDHDDVKREFAASER